MRQLWPGDARLVVQAWLGTRLVIALMVVWVMRTDGRDLLDILGNWDVDHYVTIATQGYADPSHYAFFPGWPAILHLFSLTPIPVVAGGTLVALACSAAAAAALYRLAGAAAAIAWLLAPTAVFTAVPYTESLFCAAAFWAWERARANHWGQAAALAAVASATRVSGVFLIAALAVLACDRLGTVPIRRTLRRWAWLLVPSGVVAGYVAFLYLRTGIWTAWFDAQAANWPRGFTWPWDALQHTLDAAAPGSFAQYEWWAWVFGAEVVSMAIGLVVTAYCLTRRRWAEATWVGLQVLAFSTSYWFQSVNRALLLWFPLFILAGRLLEGRRRAGWLRWAVVGVVVLVALRLQAHWAWLYLTGHWAS